MEQYLRVGFVALAIIFASACSAVIDTDGEQAPAQENVISAESAAVSECLYLEKRVEHSRGFFGSRGDDPFPMNGKTITRVEFNPSTSGSGNATITKQDRESVVVHWWLNAFS